VCTETLRRFAHSGVVYGSSCKRLGKREMSVSSERPLLRCTSRKVVNFFADVIEFDDL